MTYAPARLFSVPSPPRLQPTRVGSSYNALDLLVKISHAHDGKYYIWSDLFGGGPMRGVVLVSGLAALLAAGACTRSTRTVVLGPNPDVREAETSRGPSTAATLGVPPGHLPDEGECRVWIPGAPPGRQARRRRAPGRAPHSDADIRCRNHAPAARRDATRTDVLVGIALTTACGP